jgi:hypothetical protein
VDQYITISDNNDLDLIDNFSISFWIELYSSDAVLDNIRLIHKNNAYGVIVNGGNIRFVNYSNPLRIILGQGMDINTLYHIVCKKNGSIISFYQNNNLGTRDDPNGDCTTSNVDLFIGMDEDGSSFPIEGTIDDIRIYNRVLTPAEITQLYEEGGYTP